MAVAISDQVVKHLGVESVFTFANELARKATSQSKQIAQHGRGIFARLKFL